MTKTRARATNVESAQELEEKEADAVSKYTFKATELNPKIFEMQGMYGVKQLPEASTTQVRPFVFESDTRLEQRKQKEEALKPQIPSAAKTKTNTSLPSKGEKPRYTTAKPFSFANRDQERYQKKEEKIKDIIVQEEKMHEFHAKPLPSFSPESLPQVSVKVPTQPQPFHISNGSNAYQEKYKNKLLSEIEQDKVNRQFKAKNADVVKHKPFRPLTGVIPITNPQQVVLNSDIRAKDRAKFDDWIHEKERYAEMENKRSQKEKEAEDEEQLKQLRQDAVHKANPVRNYKPVEIQKSVKPLTEPQTPKFECKKRASMRV